MTLHRCKGPNCGYVFYEGHRDLCTYCGHEVEEFDDDKTEHDSSPLMRMLANMVGIPMGRFQRMILVLDVDAVPIIYTQGIAPRRDFEQLRRVAEHKVRHQPLTQEQMKDVERQIKPGNSTTLPKSEWIGQHPNLSKALAETKEGQTVHVNSDGSCDIRDDPVIVQDNTMMGDKSVQKHPKV
jgi:hypothetical protein